MRVLYLYSGKRKQKGQIGIDYPDTQFYGLNHLAQYGIEAEYKEFKDLPFFSRFERFLGFRLRHFLMFFLTRKYDIVFGSSLIYQMPLKIIFRPKTKFILLNIYLNRLLSAKRGKISKHFIRFLVGQLDGVVCLSNLQKNYLIENYDFPKKKLVYIPLGVDIAFHQYMPDEKRDDFILSAGSDEGRDYRLVLKIAQLCHSLKFIIVCGYKNMKGITKREIPDNVKILYYIPPKELQKLYRQAKLFLLATYPDSDIKGADCSGQTVLLDVMASGLPIIATPKLYLSDYVKNNQEIIITNSHSPQEIKEKIELLLENPSLRKRLAERARKKVENNFASQIMAQKLADYFKGFYQ